MDGSGLALANPVGRVTLVGTVFYANTTPPVPELIQVLNPHPSLVTALGVVNPFNRPVTDQPAAVTVI